MLKMTVLVENRLSPRAVAGIRPRAGLSILLDDGDRRILFDTGPDDTFIHNARLMQEPLSNLDAVILSHGHYDHCGGTSGLYAGTRIVCHPGIAQERYACIRLPARAIPLRKLSLPLDFSRLDLVADKNPRQLGTRFVWTGEIPVKQPVVYGLTDVNAGTPDYICDEGALIWRSSRGLVIITGCGHRGLENIVRHCIAITQETRLYALIGGFHLRAASPLKLINLKRFLRSVAPDIIMGCHCTGPWGRLWLRDKYALSCGDVFTFDDSRASE